MTSYNHDQVLSHWENNEVESMYDKTLLSAEIELIRNRILESSKILDAGCGEGEGTLAYAAIPHVQIHAADFSETRLQKAKDRLRGHDNVLFKKVDFVNDYKLDHDYDFVVCQRFLINITDWEIQKKILLNLMSLLKQGGKLIMLEGYVQGVDALNEIRAEWGLPDIPVQWHNLFFDDNKLLPFMKQQGFSLIEEDGLGTYFLLTRGIRPTLQDNLNWDSPFNKAAATNAVKDMLGFRDKFSRLKLWLFEK
ncbi:ubiquinone/menaquinone biosynthesis C-methyltransferase UbiE [mine drainage metagenome]|uniref:Ubiquinone/menaquinone biosynthesis C-methyltransferase UbiE n=1 Tax=mine drainage metagenome TaxID=410659 RepID=A0A1J5THU8_9ZZZZ